MKIRHHEYGEVEGVHAFYDRRSQIGWVKDGAVRFKADGWEEVPETRRVDVTGECRLEREGRTIVVPNLDVSYGMHLNLPDGLVGAVVDRYDLPPDVIERLENEFPLSGREAKEICDYLEAHKKPCLIIQKEEPCQ